ncbi:MAG: glycosyltransferase family 87 protein [Thermoanaerobaculales bacterium]
MSKASGASTGLRPAPAWRPGPQATGVVLGLSIAFYLWRNVVVALPYLRHGASDFTNYYLAARALLAGRSPFSAPNFDYPALLAFLVAPIAWLPESAARLTWFGVGHFCLIAAGVLLWRRLGSDRVAAIAVGTVWALGGTVAENLVLGQVNPLLLLALVGSWAVAWQARSRGAALIGVATAIKIWPAVLVVGDALARRWREVAVSVAVAAMLLGVPWAFVALRLPEPHAPPRAGFWIGTPSLVNCSVPAVVLRLLEPPVDREPLPPNWVVGSDPGRLSLPALHGVISVGAAAVVLAGGLWALARNARARTLREEDQTLLAAALVALALAAAPVAWYHYQLLNFPGITVLAARRLRARRIAAMALLGGVVLLATWPHALLMDPYVTRYGWTAANPVLLWLTTCVVPVADVALFAIFLGELGAAPTK